MNSRFNEIAHAAEGTCEWLLDRPEYKHWISACQGLLWIKGKPGAGKSTLLKYVLQHSSLSKPVSQARCLVVSFFFHGRGTNLQKTPLGLFRSLLYQLLSQVPSALTEVVQIFNKKCEMIGQP